MVGVGVGVVVQRLWINKIWLVQGNTISCIKICSWGCQCSDKGDWKIHEHCFFMNNSNSPVILVWPWEHFELSEEQDINGKNYIKEMWLRLLIDISMLSEISIFKLLKFNFVLNHKVVYITIFGNKMKWLLLSWKNIIWSDDLVFQSMENLHFVEIRKNKLSSFPMEILSCCPVLASLNLSNNEVSHTHSHTYTQIITFTSNMK